MLLAFANWLSSALLFCLNSPALYPGGVLFYGHRTYYDTQLTEEIVRHSAIAINNYLCYNIKMKTGVLAAATTGALLMVGGSTGAHEQFTPPQPIETHNAYLDAEATHNLTHTKDVIAKWTGLPTKLVILEGEQAYPNAILAYDRTDGPEYDSTIDTVIIGAESYNDLLVRYGGDTPRQRKAISEFVLAHEFGHGWQVQQGIKTSDDSYTSDLELQADCRAGNAAAELFPDDVALIREQMQHIIGDEHHGSTQQRIDHFVIGATSKEC